MADEEGVTLFVRKLPPDVKPKEVEDLFSQYGPLSKCFVVPCKDEKAAARGRVAFVTYSLKDDGLEAAQALDKSDFRSFALSVEPAKSKSELNATRPNFAQRVAPQKRRSGERSDPEEPGTKKGRLCVRNISFSADEGSLKKHFESFGKVDEAKLLRKYDGKLVGCGFVQFRTMHEASAALKALNAKPFLGRPIAVDWAVPKKKYEEAIVNRSEDDDNDEKEDTTVSSNEKIKAEKMEEEDEEEDGQKTKKKRKRNPHRSRGKKRKASDADGDEEDGEEEEEEEEQIVGKKLKKNVKVEQEEEEDDDDDGEEDDEEEEDEDDDEEDEEDGGKELPKKQSKNPEISRDVREGRTVFVDNVPFTSSEEDLEEFMVSQFGPVKYALFCLDPVTQHPRGTAFVQFESLEAAEKCLNADEETLAFDGRKLKVMKALARNSAQERKKVRVDEKDKPKNDKRNLYLAREGVVREGTQAAEGVSTHDMNLRKSLARSKKTALKDLTMFVSPTRLCVHNVPFAMDDAELRGVMKKHAPRGAVLTECRIMLDRKIGNVSKGFAFVNFSRHEDALATLRAINNSPEVFSATRRPIVEFSIESKLALQAREKRLARSREKQPTKPKEGFVQASKENRGKIEAEAPRTAETALTKRDKYRLKSLKRYQEKRRQKRLEKGDDATAESSPSKSQPAEKAKQRKPQVEKPAKKKKEPAAPMVLSSSDRAAMLKSVEGLTGQQRRKELGRFKKRIRAQEKKQMNPEAPKGAEKRKPVEKADGQDFVGAKSDPAKKGTMGLPSHEGPKVRHKARPTSISRKVLRKKQKKPFQKKEASQFPTRDGPMKNVQGKQNGAPDKGKQRGGSMKKSMDKSGAEFQAMVDKYKSKLSAPTGRPSGQDAGMKKKWFDG